MAGIKPVPPEVLKAFGFKKLRGKPKHFSTATHYNAELEVFYDPTMHTMKTFADNFVASVLFALSKNISSEMANLRPRIR